VIGAARVSVVRERRDARERLALVQHVENAEYGIANFVYLPEVGEPIFTGFNTAKLIEVHFDAQGRASQVRLSLT